MLACGRKGEEDKVAPFLKEVYSRHWIVAEAAKMVGELGSGEAARLIFHGKSELMLSFRWQQRTDASKVYTAQQQRGRVTFILSSSPGTQLSWRHKD